MVARRFTLEQAHALIPWLSEIFSDQQSDVHELLVLKGRGPGAERVEALEGRIRSRVEAVTSLGIRVLRVDGMVEIPADQSGKPIMLQWRLGEDRIHRWRPAKAADLEFAPRRRPPSRFGSRAAPRLPSAVDGFEAAPTPD